MGLLGSRSGKSQQAALTSGDFIVASDRTSSLHCRGEFPAKWEVVYRRYHRAAPERITCNMPPVVEGPELPLALRCERPQSANRRGSGICRLRISRSIAPSCLFGTSGSVVF